MSTPLTWEEVGRNPKATDFNLLNIEERLRSRGELISRMRRQQLSHVLQSIPKR